MAERDYLNAFSRPTVKGAIKSATKAPKQPIYALIYGAATPIYIQALADLIS
jgi:hypothetical protein